jgi:hypothetical protein
MYPEDPLNAESDWVCKETGNISDTVEFRVPIDLLAGFKALGFGQIEWTCKKKSPIVRTW